MVNPFMQWLIVPVFAAAVAAGIPFTTVAKGDASEQETVRQATVRTPAEWQALWKDHSLNEKLPVVDFTSKMVVGVFLGTKPSTGYEVEIVGARVDGEALVVEYVQRQPKRGTMAAQILTEPFHLVTLPRHTGQVRFVQVPDPAPPPPATTR
jgi:hypothetical protein